MSEEAAAAAPYVLIVDDEPTLSFLLKGSLKRINANVLEAQNGVDALALIKNKKPKVAVLDVMLPFMSGWELSQKIKQHCAPDKCYIIILTAKGGELDEIRSYESGADAFFSKPANYDDVAKTIETMLEWP